MIPEAAKKPAVWQVVELAELGDGKAQEQQCFLLSTSAVEAAQIVGETEERKILTVHHVCDITGLPDQKYVPMPVEAYRLQHALEKWSTMTDAAMRLTCGEMTAQEIRTVRSVIQSIIASVQQRDE